jgi:hypothetical protein
MHLFKDVPIERFSDAVVLQCVVRCEAALSALAMQKFGELIASVLALPV